MLNNSFVENMGTPLTANGGKFALLPALQDVICLLQDSRLLVSKSHMFSPGVKGFIGRLDRIGYHYELLQVDLSVISAAYAGAKSSGANSSDMQKAASDLFKRATKARASDIHIRASKRQGTLIFFRVHSDLVFQEEATYEYGTLLCTTIYQAMADVADATYEILSRQDARISDRNKIPHGIDGIRIATSPQVDGLIMVLRLLYNDAEKSIDPIALGYMSEQADDLMLMKKKPTGINIIGGPTGSGKSTTLQRLLGSIVKDSRGRKNIITVEDPPEYPILGAVQTPVTNADSAEERSMAFESAIKAAMRLDPDVIMIGEVRDRPSASLAVQAAMTGHQVWTTVHANGAFAIVDRLIDLGVPIELACDPTIITGLACQRLLKVLCPSCRKPITEVMDRYATKDVERIMSVLPISDVYVCGDGCSHCNNSGITGRTVVAETVVTNEKLMSFLRVRDRVGAMRYWRSDLRGFGMLDHAILKIKDGLVDPFQAEDVVGDINIRAID